MKRIYKPSGNDKVGHRINIPSYVEFARAYRCEVKDNGELIYTPIEVRKTTETLSVRESIEKEKARVGERPEKYWNVISGECFSRDAYTCQNCKKSVSELIAFAEHERVSKSELNVNWKLSDYQLQCHHIVPLRDGGNNELDNLSTVCGKCHTKIHTKHKVVP